jgi:hypothetical protein
MVKVAAQSSAFGCRLRIKGTVRGKPALTDTDYYLSYFAIKIPIPSAISKQHLKSFDWL